MVGGGSIIVKYCRFWRCAHLCERWQTSLKGYCTLYQQAHEDKGHTYDSYGNISSGLRNGAWKTRERVVSRWHLLTLRLACCCHAEEAISCLSSQCWCIPLPPTLPATATTVPSCGILTGRAAPASSGQLHGRVDITGGWWACSPLTALSLLKPGT